MPLLSETAPFVQVTLFLLALVYLYLLGVMVVNAKRLRLAREGVEEIESKHIRYLNAITDFLERDHAPRTGISAVLGAGLNEYLSAQKMGLRKENAIESAKTAIQASLREEIERLENHLPTLATIGSASPYIGLLGAIGGVGDLFTTVGGTEHLRMVTVTHGISGALVAIVFGLLIAIQSVIVYNRTIGRVQSLDKRYQVVITDFLGLLQRI